MAAPKPFTITTKDGTEIPVKTSPDPDYNWLLEMGGKRWHVDTKDGLFALVKKLGFEVK